MVEFYMNKISFNRGGLAVNVRELASIDPYLNFLINGRQVELVTHSSPNVIYLSRIICQLLQENGGLPNISI